MRNCCCRFNGRLHSSTRLSAIYISTFIPANFWRLMFAPFETPPSAKVLFAIVCPLIFVGSTGLFVLFSMYI